jgi:uncharacterized protein
MLYPVVCPMIPRVSAGAAHKDHQMTRRPLAHLASPGSEIAVRVTPKASRNLVKIEAGQIRVYVTCVPEDGKANKEVVKLLAKAIGTAKSNLTLLRGATARDKVFRVLGQGRITPLKTAPHATAPRPVTAPPGDWALRATPGGSQPAAAGKELS